MARLRTLGFGRRGDGIRFTGFEVGRFAICDKPPALLPRLPADGARCARDVTDLGRKPMILPMATFGNHPGHRATSRALAKPAPQRGQPPQHATSEVIERGTLIFKRAFSCLFSRWKKGTRPKSLRSKPGGTPLTCRSHQSDRRHRTSQPANQRPNDKATKGPTNQPTSQQANNAFRAETAAGSSRVSRAPACRRPPDPCAGVRSWPGGCRSGGRSGGRCGRRG